MKRIIKVCNSIIFYVYDIEVGVDPGFYEN